MESKIAGYKLVPSFNDCEGCSFAKYDECPEYFCNDDCYKFNAIYVPADTEIEVPKINKQDNER